MKEEKKQTLVELVKIAKQRDLTDEEKKVLIELNTESVKQLDQELQDEINVTIQAQLSVRERLMRRRATKRIKTTFEDDVGDFVVETRLMTSAERLVTMEAVALMQKAEEDITNYPKAILMMRVQVKELCLNVDADFWDSIDATDDVILAVMYKTLYGGVEEVGEGLKKFR